MPVVAAYHMVAFEALTTARPPSLSIHYLALPNIAAALLSQGRGSELVPLKGRWRGLGRGRGLGRETVISAGWTLSVAHAAWIALVSSWSTPHGFIRKADSCPTTIFINTLSCVTTSCSCSVVSSDSQTIVAWGYVDAVSVEHSASVTVAVWDTCVTHSNCAQHLTDIPAGGYNEAQTPVLHEECEAVVNLVPIRSPANCISAVPPAGAPEAAS